MAGSSLPLTSLSEAQRAQAQERFRIVCPALDKEITQAEVARTHQISVRTVQRWIKNYREHGLAGLADATRNYQEMVVAQLRRISETMKAEREAVSLSSVLSSRWGHPSQLCHNLKMSMGNQFANSIHCSSEAS